MKYIIGSAHALPYPADAHGWQGCSGPLDWDGRADCSLIGRCCARPRRLLPVFLAWPFPLATTSSEHQRPSLILTHSWKVVSLIYLHRPTHLSSKQRHRRFVHVVSSDKHRAEPSGTAAGYPPRLSKHRERTCILFITASNASPRHASIHSCFGLLSAKCARNQAVSERRSRWY